MESPSQMPPALDTNTASDSLITTAHIVYGLQAVGLFVTPLLIVALIINYVKRDDVRGTFLESHFRWQIRTFWFSVLWVVVGVLTLLLLIGYAILFALWVWMVYRVVKGWWDLAERKAMYR